VGHEGCLREGRGDAAYTLQTVGIVEEAIEGLALSNRTQCAPRTQTGLNRGIRGLRGEGFGVPRKPFFFPLPLGVLALGYLAVTGKKTLESLMNPFIFHQ
jgi:hypothetical protein